MTSSRWISRIESRTHCRPKSTRGLFSRICVCEPRVSTACWKTAIRVSCHRRLPNSIGEFVATASTGPVTTCARLYIFANSRAPTCQWIWKLALHASTITESCCTISSSTPLMRDLVRLPPQRRQRAVEREVARGWASCSRGRGRTCGSSGGCPSGGAGRRCPRRPRARAPSSSFVWRSRSREALAPERQRVEVELQVEERDLGDEVRVGDALEHLRSRPAPGASRGRRGTSPARRRCGARPPRSSRSRSSSRAPAGRAAGAA